MSRDERLVKCVCGLREFFEVVSESRLESYGLC